MERAPVRHYAISYIEAEEGLGDYWTFARIDSFWSGSFNVFG